MQLFIAQNNKQTIVTDNGVINTISYSEKILKVNVGEREYKVPDVFICGKFTVTYKMENNGGLRNIKFEDLETGKYITIKYDYLNSKVYEIIAKPSI